jgi:hypothetical protein
VYTTDGTASGTEKLSEAVNGSYYLDYELINNVLYCNTYYDNKLYRSDGTLCGSFFVDTGIPEADYYYGQRTLGSLNNLLIFGATKEPYGNEPFSINTLLIQSPCAGQVASAESSSTTQAQFITQSPNPFTSDFSLTIKGNDGEAAEVSVYSFGGKPVEKFAAESNTKYNLGSNWPQGLYIVKVNKGGTVETQRVFKK